MSCQETVQTLCYVWGICRQRVDTISTCKCVIIAVSWFQIWSESNLAISSIFATFTDFCCPWCLEKLSISRWLRVLPEAGWLHPASAWMVSHCHTGMLATVIALGSITHLHWLSPERTQRLFLLWPRHSIRDNFMNCKGCNLCTGSTHGFTEDFLVTLTGFDRMYGRIRH